MAYKRDKINKQGFTLIEVVVVMAIIAVLAVLIIGAIQVARNTAGETRHRSDAKAIQIWLEAQYADTKSYPCSDSDGWSCSYYGPQIITFGEINDARYANGKIKLSTPSSDCYGWGGGLVIFGPNPQDFGWYFGLANGRDTNYEIMPVKADCTDYLWNDKIIGP